MFAKEVMDSSIVTVNERATLEEVLEMARVHKTADFVIVDSDLNYCGMLFEAELLKRLYSETEKNTSSGQAGLHKSLKDELRRVPVRALMRSGLRAFALHETVESMAELMLFERISKMAVVDQGAKVVGIVSLSRILSNLWDQLAKQSPVVPAEPRKSEAEDVKNKRFFQRVPFGAPLAYRRVQKDDREVSEGKIAQAINVSAGGLLILTQEKLPPEQTLNVALDLYQNNNPLRTVCRIVRCLPSKREGYFEVGLMFIAIGIDERRRLEEHLKKQSSAPGHDGATTSL